MKLPGIMALGLLALAGMALIQPAPILGAQELTVSAAASLTNAFPEIGQRFEQQHPGTKVIFNFAASGPLLQQIAQGAPVDVFASADQKTMNQAQEKGLIVPASRKNFVSNTLVLIVPQDSKLTLIRPSRPALSRGQKGGGGQSRQRAGGPLYQRGPGKGGVVGDIVPQIDSGGIGAPGAGLREPGRGGCGPCLLHRRRHCQGEGETRGHGQGASAHRLSGGPGGGQSASKPWAKNF